MTAAFAQSHHNQQERNLTQPHRNGLDMLARAIGRQDQGNLLFLLVQLHQSLLLHRIHLKEVREIHPSAMLGFLDQGLPYIQHLLKEQSLDPKLILDSRQQNKQSQSDALREIRMKSSRSLLGCTHSVFTPFNISHLLMR